MPRFCLCGCDVGNHNTEFDRENPHEITLSVLLFTCLLDYLSIQFIIIIGRSFIYSLDE